MAIIYWHNLKTRWRRTCGSWCNVSGIRPSRNVENPLAHPVFVLQSFLAAYLCFSFCTLGLFWSVLFVFNFSDVRSLSLDVGDQHLVCQFHGGSSVFNDSFSLDIFIFRVCKQHLIASATTKQVWFARPLNPHQNLNYILYKRVMIPQTPDIKIFG